jgi:lipopolysaccharide transport system permease protein
MPSVRHPWFWRRAIAGFLGSASRPVNRVQGKEKHMSSMRVISSRAQFFPDLAEAWQARALAVMLARRNIKIRYMQTLLGSLWIIGQPILLTGALTIVGGMLLAAPSDGLPYALFAFTGTTLWSLFQRTVTDTSTSLALSSSIIMKVYFPRVLVPLSSALTAAFDSLPAFALMLGVVVYYGAWPGWIILLSPLFLLIALVLGFAIGLWVTMLDAIYRDIRLIIPSVLQILFYLSPVMYAARAVPAKWHLVYDLNPIVGLIKAFRWSTVAGMPPPDLVNLAYCVGLTGFMLLAGLFIFARLEQYAVDKI